MHDFDADRHARGGYDRRFKIGGHEFAFKATVSGDLLARYFDLLAKPDTENFNQAALAAADDVILSWLEPDYTTLWREVRSPEHADPLTILDVTGVVSYLTGSISDRDQEQPSGSSDTSEKSGTSSTAKSSSPVAVASQA